MEHQLYIVENKQFFVETSKFKNAMVYYDVCTVQTLRSKSEIMFTFV